MKKTIIISILILTVSFLTYCFYPVIFYKWNNLDIWRIYLTDRNWLVITDKAKPDWYKLEDKNFNLESEFIKSLLVIEDKNYFNHFWVNILSKFRALKDNLSWKQISWWSTITEQYIKNKYFEINKRTYLQKSREWILAFTFSINNNKNIILNNYLNNIYFWNNIYWLNTAINIYFEKLTEEEITLLISLLHNPWIKSLEEKSFRNYFEKVKNKLQYNFERTIFKLNKKENIDIFPFVSSNPSLNSLPLRKEGGYKTSIDSKLQQYAKDILNKTLDELKNKNVTNWAIFAIDPKTWEVLIYQASRDFNSTEIDWQVDVIKALRQPWSTMKPFLYLMALENWAEPEDLVLDLENEYNSFQKWKTYISNNYSLKEYWLVRFKKALWNSLNNATVRLARELWLNEVYKFYKKYNFKLDKTPEHYGYSLVLWNPSIRLFDLVLSYSKLLDLKDKNKFLLYDILSDPDNRDLSFWVNSILNTSIYQAVKTWTSSDFRDNLIISYHPDFVIWIWIGNNDNSSMVWVTWITWAGYIWHHIIEKATKLWYITDKQIEIPEWIVESEYCLDEKCFRKELIYKKTNKEYYSRLVENKYSKKDLFEKLSVDEINRLKDFQIYFD